MPLSLRQLPVTDPSKNDYSKPARIFLNPINFKKSRLELLSDTA